MSKSAAMGGCESRLARAAFGRSFEHAVVRDGVPHAHAGHLMNNGLEPTRQLGSALRRLPSTGPHGGVHAHKLAPSGQAKGSATCGSARSLKPHRLG